MTRCVRLLVPGIMALALVPGCGVVNLVGGVLGSPKSGCGETINAVDQARPLDWQDGTGTVEDRIDYWGDYHVYEIPGARQGDRLSITLESLPSPGGVLVPVLAVLDDQGEVVDIVGVHNLTVPEVWTQFTTHRFPPGDRPPPPQTVVHVVRRDTSRLFLVVYHAQTLWFCGPYRLTAEFLGDPVPVPPPRKRTVAVNFDGAAAVDVGMYPELQVSTVALDPCDTGQILPPGMDDRREDLIELILAWVAVYFDRYDVTIIRSTPETLASADVVIHIVNPGTLDRIGFFSARGVELSIGRDDGRPGVALVECGAYEGDNASDLWPFLSDQNDIFDIGRYNQLRDVLEPIAQDTGTTAAHEIGHTLGLVHVDSGLMQWDGRGFTFDRGQIQIGGTYLDGFLEEVTIPGARQDADRWLADHIGRVDNPEPRRRLAQLLGWHYLP